MISKLKDFIKRKQEFFVVGILAIFILSSLIFFTKVESIYETNSLSILFLNVFGTLFGLLLTSYAILFGLIPALSIDTLETQALESVNSRFFISLLINLFIIILSLSIIFLDNSFIFLDNSFKIYLIYIQLFLVVSLILMFSLLIFYLMLLFRGAKINAIKDRKKRLNLF